MLTIIHGSDLAASRKFFQDEKARISGAVMMQQAEVNLTSLAQILEGGGLFEEAKALFVEQFLSERKKSTEKDAVIAYLIKQGAKHDIFLWEGKEIATSSLSVFKGAIVKNFKLPSSLFALLDALKPGNGKKCMQLFHEALASTEAEMIFFMIVRQLRILIALRDPGQATITEVSRLAPWQRGKLEAQARGFDFEQLVEKYSELFEIEKMQKTGNLSTNLVNKVDFFLLEF